VPDPFLLEVIEYEDLAARGEGRKYPNAAAFQKEAIKSH
jgi:hypothetical protein